MICGGVNIRSIIAIAMLTGFHRLAGADGHHSGRSCARVLLFASHVGARPCNREEEGAVFHRLNLMKHAAIERDQTASAQIESPSGGFEMDVT